MTTIKSPWDTTGPSIFNDKAAQISAGHSARQTAVVEKHRKQGRDLGTITGISKKADAVIRTFKQPPHFGKVGQQDVPRTTDPLIQAAERAIRDSAFARGVNSRSNGTRPSI